MPDTDLISDALATGSIRFINDEKDGRVLEIVTSSMRPLPRRRGPRHGERASRRAMPHTVGDLVALLCAAQAGKA